MNRIIKIISVIFISVFFCFLSYRLCYFIAEKYFFDKFFYKKSTTHGYWLENKPPSDYGDQAKAISFCRQPVFRLFSIIFRCSKLNCLNLLMLSMTPIVLHPVAIRIGTHQV